MGAYLSSRVLLGHDCSRPVALALRSESRLHLLSLDDPDLLAELNNPCLKNLIKLLPSLDCDPDFQALIRAILGIEDAGARAN